MATDQLVQVSGAVFRGTVVSIEPYVDEKDGCIYTRTVFQISETFKGKLPALVQVVHRGGTVDGRGEIEGFAPNFQVGEERLLFVSRGADGNLRATQGESSAVLTVPAKGHAVSHPTAEKLLKELRGMTAHGVISGDDLRDQAATSLPAAQLQSAVTLSAAPVNLATNLLVGSDGIGARFVLPDRGEPIPYLIDADYLPAGITQTAAVTAVQNALNAWTGVTSIRYKLAGIQSFGQAAGKIINGDGTLRIQLHDHYNYLSGGNVLGQGGHSWWTNTLSSGWTRGGNVAGSDFHRVSNGYVVLQHTNLFMQDIVSFTEVLCHEIGHTIGLAHSSVNPNELNPILKQACMYYAAHGDGRGAALNSYDINVSRQIHPIDTPPYAYSRVMDVVSSPGTITTPGVNKIEIRGYDLQTTNLVLATTDATAKYGTFTVQNGTLSYTPAGYYADSARVDPAGSSYYDIIYVRCSDGLNASPYAAVRILSYVSDAYNEGIPDSWRSNYFGSANPSIGSKHHALDDADGDGFTNLQEYWLGSNPTNKTSNLSITLSGTNLQWVAKPYEVYEVYSSTDLVTWVRARNPIVPTNSPATLSGMVNNDPRQFYRIQKVP